MLKDLEQIGDYVSNSGGCLLTRRMSFEPFVKCIESNISAFLKYSSMKDTCCLYDTFKHWCREETPTYLQFTQRIRANAVKWMRCARQHPDALNFIQEHLMNVILLWPKVLQKPRNQDRLKLDTRAAIKRLQRIAKKMKAQEPKDI
jgi:hypothetical protein